MQASLNLKLILHFKNDLVYIFTINETVITQKICDNRSWMKRISSYVHPLFLKKIKKMINYNQTITEVEKIFMEIAVLYMKLQNSNRANYKFIMLEQKQLKELLEKLIWKWYVQNVQRCNRRMRKTLLMWLS